ncbi:MAG: DUF4097 domain-containing protein [Planctomycetes bacterium]|nr:DUF4097 domain-containing protein [Planctomycetota bacterium]
MSVRPSRLVPPLLAFAGCGFPGSVEFDGVSVQAENGVVSVDGVALPHSRWVPLDVPADVGALKLGCATRELQVATAGPGEPARLEVQLFSQVEGEGVVALEAGKFVAQPTAAGRVLANGVRGTIPAGVRLHAYAGTGRVSVGAAHGLGGLEADNGTGDVDVAGGPLGDVRIRNGTGSSRLDGATAGSVVVKSGTGAVAVTGSSCVVLEAESGSGSVTLTGLACERLDLKLGTGDVRLDDCTAARSHIQSGTGDVTQAGQTDLGQAEFDLGTGQVRREPAP